MKTKIKDSPIHFKSEVLKTLLNEKDVGYLLVGDDLEKLSVADASEYINYVDYVHANKRYQRKW